MGGEGEWCGRGGRERIPGGRLRQFDLVAIEERGREEGREERHMQNNVKEDARQPHTINTPSLPP